MAFVNVHASNARPAPLPPTPYSYSYSPPSISTFTPRCATPDDQKQSHLYHRHYHNSVVRPANRSVRPNAPLCGISIPCCPISPYPSPSTTTTTATTNTTTSLSASPPNSQVSFAFSSSPSPSSLVLQELVPVSKSIVWFRIGDLRVDDHPGIDAARAFTRHAVSYVVTCSTPTTTLTVDAIARLRVDLQKRGERLHVRVAYSPDEEVDALVAFAHAVGAQRLHVCLDIDNDTIRVIETVQTRLQPNSPGSGSDSTADVIELITWIPQTLHDWDDVSSDMIEQAPDIFPQFVRWRRRTVARTPTVEPLVPFLISPAMPAGGDNGADDEFPERSLLARGNGNGNGDGDLPVRAWREQFQQRYDEDMTLTGGIQNMQAAEPGYGERQMLAYLEGAENDTDGLPDLGRSLSEVFRQGALSHPQMRAIVERYERSNGRIFYQLYREAAKLVLRTLEAQEFSTVLARRDVVARATVDGLHRARFWRWNGFLIRYVDEGPTNTNPHNNNNCTTPVLLIHGFGASSFHFEKSVRLIKKSRRVLALDILGFGRSDKPPMRYTNPVWEALVWDFVREVVKQPVYVAGNSIGGIFASNFGIDAYPLLCSGICLINTAGRLTDGTPSPAPAPASVPATSTSSSYSSPGSLTTTATTSSTSVNSSPAASADVKPEKEATSPSPSPPPPMRPPSQSNNFGRYVFSRWRWTRILAGRLLLRSLQGRVRRTLNVVYPTNPLSEDSGLPREIMRASYDFGAVDVLASGIIAPKTRSFETLLRQYNGPLLVFNGILDPLGNVRMRTESLRVLYPKATVVTVEAGHCPHDEVPDSFVDSLMSWIDDIEQNSTENKTVEESLEQQHV